MATEKVKKDAKKNFLKKREVERSKVKEMIEVSWNETKNPDYPLFVDLPESFQQEKIKEGTIAIARGEGANDFENYVVKNYIEPETETGNGNISETEK